MEAEGTEDMSCENPIHAVRLKDIPRFVLKHRGVSHPVAGGVYENKLAALTDLESIPAGNPDCRGCGVGCRAEYEVVDVFITVTPPKRVWRKLNVVTEKT